MEEFEDVLNSFLHMDNVDVYVTGSNSKFLSSDIITEFRGRGDEVRVYPLSFSEFYSAKEYESCEDVFLIEKAVRYDIKGKKYINTPYKYYFVDMGLRNARLNFRRQEETHIMENIVYNELRIRGYAVDVGIVDIYKKMESIRKNRSKWIL